MPDFAKCFCMPETVAIVYSIILFICAYSLYRVLLFLFHRFTGKTGMGAKVGQQIRYPILFILFEIAAVLSLKNLNLPEGAAKACEHAINVMIIATLGWFAVGITRAFYQKFVENSKGSEGVDLNRRSLLTQILFLYRLLIFAIIALTAGSILLTFPYIKNVGFGILGSAGIAGIALGMAARPILLNLIAGFQIAITKMVKIGDAIFVEGSFARVEEIHLTRVVVCTSDLRRIVIPISNFIDKPFENWDLSNPELLAMVFLYCDFTVPVGAIRKKAEEIITVHPKWNKKTWNVQVTNCTEKTVEVRVVASTYDANSLFELRSYIREALIEFLQKEYPHCLPCERNRVIS